jgi:hypothetical protein
MRGKRRRVDRKGVARSNADLLKEMIEKANVHVERLAKLLPRNDEPADAAPIETMH